MLIIVITIMHCLYFMILKVNETASEFSFPLSVEYFWTFACINTNLEMISPHMQPNQTKFFVNPYLLY